jgi:glycosyltransferase 2 family protein
VKNFLKVTGGLLVSAFFVWLTLRGKDTHAIWAAIKNVDLRYIGGYFMVLTGIHLVRTIRWGILVEPLDPEIGFKRLNAVAAVGFMLLITLPFRLGELARPALLADKKKITISNSMASIVVERVIDGLAMTMLLLVTLLFVHGQSAALERIRYFGWVFFSIFGGGGLFLVFAAWKHDLAVRMVHGVADRISPKLAEKGVSLIDSFITGLKTVPSLGKLALYGVLTVTYWGLNGIGLGVLARGFGMPLSPLAMYTTLAVLTVGIMIPAGPGMAGTFQYFTGLGLGLFMPAATMAVAGSAFAQVVWGMQFGQQALFGLVFMALGHIKAGQALHASEALEPAIAPEIAPP